MIEDIEERLLRLGLTDEPLDIVNDEHIHLLVEVYEHTTLGTAHQAVTDELCFELRARHVADAHRGVELHGTLPNSLREVGLPYATGAIDEDEVQRSLPRACSRSFGDAQGLAVTSTLVESLKAEVGTEVRRIVLRARQLRLRCWLSRLSGCEVDLEPLRREDLVLSSYE